MRIPALTLAAFLLGAGSGYVDKWVPIASAQGQDPLPLTRALERAEQFYVAIGPKPQPTAKWVGEDRVAYSPAGKAPWTVLDAATGQVLQSEADDAAVGGPGLHGHAPARWRCIRD